MEANRQFLKRVSSEITNAILNFMSCIQGPEMIRCSRVYKDAKDGKFMKYLYEDSKTVYEAFRRGAKESSLLMHCFLIFFIVALVLMNV